MHLSLTHFTKILRLLAIVFIFSAISLFLFSGKISAVAGINRQINFQGKLVDNPLKTNVADTSYTVIFTIYDRASGGTALWTETQTVTTADGIFRVALGSSTAFPANFNFNWDGLYLGMRITAPISNSEMTPRVQLTAVPYAFNAEKVAGLTVQDTSGNASTSGTLQIPNAKTINLGTQNLTLTTSGDTTLTLPTTGTVCVNTNNCGYTSGTNFWKATAIAGAITPINNTLDLLVGGDTTASARFAVFNIAGSLIPTASLSAGTTGAAYLTAAGNLQTTAFQTLSLGGTTTGDITFTPKNIQALYLSGIAGRVGLGTQTNPNGLLDISGSAGNNAALIINQTGGNANDYILAASVSGVTKFVIDNSGRVGVGTSAPLGASLLNISEDLNTVFPSADDNAQVIISGKTNSNLTLQLGFDTTDEYGYIRANKVGTGTRNLILQPDSGFVGINTVSPLAALDVNGSASVGGNFTLYGAGYKNIATTLNNELRFGGGTTGDISFFPGNAANTLYLKTGGSVGINTASPLANLDVNGTASISGALKLYSTPTIQSTAMKTLTLGGDTTGNIVLTPNNGSGGRVSFTSAAINLGGSDGTASQCLLGGAAAAWGSCGSGGDSSNWTLSTANGVLSPNNNTLDLLIGGTTTASAKFAVLNVNGTGPVTASVSGNLIVMPTNGAGGRIGIGTTSPQFPLHIVSNAAGNDYIMMDTYDNTPGALGSRYVGRRARGTSGNPSAIQLDDEIVGFGGRGYGTNAFDTGPSARMSYWAGQNWTDTNQGTYITWLTNTNNTSTLTEKMRLTDSGILAIGTTSPLATLDVRANLVNGGTISVASVSGATSFAGLLVDNTGVGDLFTASKSGATKFTILNNGNLQFTGTTNFLTTLASAATAARTITFPDATGTLCIQNSTNCGFVQGTNFWKATAIAGAITPINNTLDLLVGGDTTASARFAVFNIAGSLTPTASLSAGTTGASYLTAAGNLQTTAFQTLSLGGATTGDISFTPKNIQTLYLSGKAGRVGLGTITNPNGLLTISGDAGSNATLILNNTGVNTSDLFTASASGTTKFTIQNGGTASSSGDFIFDSAGNIQTTKKQTLTLGGTTTGNIIMNPGNATGFVGINNSSPSRTIDVTGTWGGNVVTTATSDDGTTSTIATKALAYFVSSTDTAGTCATAAKTFNITGLSSTEGSYAFIVSKAIAGGCTSNATSLIVTVQINGNQISTLPDTATGVTATENYTVAYINGVWRIVGLNSGVAQAAAGSDTADLAEWIESVGEKPQPGELISITASQAATVVKSASPYDKNLMGVVSTNPHTTMGQETPTSVKLALAGRVPVKVITENGPISPGDRLTSSSIPGVAMKATKAGTVIGMALGGFNGEGIGYVTVFVNTGNFSGEQLKEVLAGQGLDLINNGSSSSNIDFGLITLAHLLRHKEEITSQETELSEIYTDRIAAGLEIITPKITTHEISLDTIKPATGADVSLNLSEDGKFIIKNSSGSAGITFESNGNAFFAGTLTADKIKANQIEGLEFSVRDQLLSMRDLLNPPTPPPSTPSGNFDILGDATSSSQTDFVPVLNSKMLNLAGLNVDGLATVSAQLRVKGNGLFEGILTVIDSITTNNFIATGISNFFGEVIFRDKVTFSSDIGGNAVIKKDGRRVEVVFDNEFEKLPIVNASVSFEEQKDGDGNVISSKDLEDEFFNNNYSYIIVNKSTKGFTIVLNKDAAKDVSFTWTALRVKDAKSIVSN